MRDELDSGELKGPRRWWAELRRAWDEQLQTNGLLRHLVHEPWFLVATSAVLLCGLGAVAVIPKVWSPAPEGFSRVVKVSLLDYLQAWNLRRTALRAQAEGRWDEALVAWRTAIVNNLADRRLHQGVLEMLRQAPLIRSANLPLALFSGEILIELSGTNRADSLLVADVLVRHRLPEVAIQAIRAWEREFTPEEEAVWLRALHTAGQVRAFESRWSTTSEKTRSDPRISLYRASLDAVGPPDRAVDGLEKLRAALDGSADRLEAARLLCWAALRRDDATEYGRGLAVLREAKSTMVQDEVGAWTLLTRKDRVDEAREAARRYGPLPPPTPMEAIQLTRAWSELGLGDLGVALFRDHIEHYGHIFEVWAAYFDLLMERKQWDDVRRVATNLRGNASAKDDVVATAWYAEAMADLAVGRGTSAKSYLRRLKEATISNPSVALRLAAGLIRAGEYEASSELLARQESALAGHQEYWLQVIVNAQGRKDVETMQKATDRLLVLDPESLIGLNMRLGLMLLKRESPAEALTLSVRLNALGNASVGAVINHAVALLQNARTADAGLVLARLDPNRLGPMERAAWQLAKVEYFGESGRHAEALGLGEKVDSEQLMPPDSEWLAMYLRECRRKVEKTTP